MAFTVFELVFFLMFLDASFDFRVGRSCIRFLFLFVSFPSPHFLFYLCFLRKHPKELFRPDNGYDHRDAWFGVPPYGSTIRQNVYYADSTMCDPTVDYSRGGFPRRTRDASHRMAPWKPPFILLIDRGGDCTHVMQVRNAQKTGATAALMVRSTCLCDSGDACVPDVEQTTCYVDFPTMNDDGTGADVTIPSFFLLKQDGDPVKYLLMNDTAVRAEMSWTLPSQTTHVEYELWTTPQDKGSASIKQSFREIAVALGEHARFTPHFYFTDGACECFDEGTPNRCDSHCTSDGRYCSVYDSYMDEGFSGAMVIIESLRQLCIWRLYGVDGVGLRWWDYIKVFESRCDQEVDENFDYEGCVKEAMQRSGIDYNKVSSCMKSTGGIGEGVSNSILDQELIASDAHEQELDIVLPSFYVNQSPIRGAMTTSVVFIAICAGFISGSEPPICKQCHQCSDVDICIEIGFCPGRSNPNVLSLSLSTGSVVGVFVCISILAYLPWVRSKRQMRGQKQGSSAAEFMPLQTFELSKRWTIGT